MLAACKWIDSHRLQRRFLAQALETPEDSRKEKPYISFRGGLPVDKWRDIPRPSAVRYFLSPDLNKLGEAFVEGRLFLLC